MYNWSPNIDHIEWMDMTRFCFVFFFRNQSRMDNFRQSSLKGNFFQSISALFKMENALELIAKKRKERAPALQKKSGALVDALGKVQKLRKCKKNSDFKKDFLAKTNKKEC